MQAEAKASIFEHEKQSEEKQRRMREAAEEREAERRKKAAAVREWKVSLSYRIIHNKYPSDISIFKICTPSALPLSQRQVSCT